MRLKFNKEIEFFIKKFFFSESFLLKRRLERSIKKKDEKGLVDYFNRVKVLRDNSVKSDEL